jgi:integrase
LRQLPSGRYQVRYLGPDGLRRAAPRTFATRADARRWLSLVEGEIVRGIWEDLTSEGEPLSTYGGRWIAERQGLSQRSIELYAGLLRLRIAPGLGAKGIRKITPADVRSWRQGLLDAGVGPSTVSKAYRLLRAIFNTAFDDELIHRNPCRIKGAGVEHPAERPVLTLEQVMVVADAIDPRYRLLVLLAVFASLRWGELIGLRKTDFDLVDGLVRIERSIVLIGAEQVVKRPKTAAGVRTVAFPRWLLALVEAHFRDYSDPDPDGAVFVGPYGKTPARPNFSPIWRRAITAAGQPGSHFHDLRHTGNHFAAMSGAARAS